MNRAWKNKAEHMSTQVSAARVSRRGFTLIEVLIVLAIAALLSAMVFAGFSSLSNGHRRTSCQANMAQIYAAARQYALDEGGKFPHYDPTEVAGERGIGLWVLYGFPSVTDYDAIAPPPTQPNPRPLERYIRSSKNLHCPGHTTDTNLLDAAGTAYNPAYLSYQGVDADAAGGARDRNLYITTRTTSTTPSANWKRQLIHYDGTTLVRRPPTDDTVVTWCPYHRGSSGVKLDNVLFYDGSVQVIPFTDETAWLRNPKNPS